MPSAVAGQRLGCASACSKFVPSLASRAGIKLCFRPADPVSVSSTDYSVLSTPYTVSGLCRRSLCTVCAVHTPYTVHTLARQREHHRFAPTRPTSPGPTSHRHDRVQSASRRGLLPSSAALARLIQVARQRDYRSTLCVFSSIPIRPPGGLTGLSRRLTKCAGAYSCISAGLPRPKKCSEDAKRGFSGGHSETGPSELRSTTKKDSSSARILICSSVFHFRKGGPRSWPRPPIVSSKAQSPPCKIQARKQPDSCQSTYAVDFISRLLIPQSILLPDKARRSATTSSSSSGGSAHQKAVLYCICGGVLLKKGLSKRDGQIGGRLTFLMEKSAPATNTTPDLTTDVSLSAETLWR